MNPGLPHASAFLPSLATHGSPPLSPAHRLICNADPLRRVPSAAPVLNASRLPLQSTASSTSSQSHASVSVSRNTHPTFTESASKSRPSLSPNSPTVHIYDTTLRDGAQGEGISLSVTDKLKIAARLDDIGVHYIEGGWPGSNPKDELFFSQCTNLNNARLVAFGSTRHKNATCETDKNVQALVSTDTPVVTLVGKAHASQVSLVLGATLQQNLDMISDTVRYFKQLGREVMLDAEHFFDGFVEDQQYSISCLSAAVDAGADVLVLCDTNGGSVPWFIARVVQQISQRFPNTRIGVHCHNDMDLAVANSLAAVHSGASLVQGTVNGYGERTGNANLMSIIPTLQLKMSHSILGDRLAGLTNLSRFVDEIANQPHVPSRPFVGSSSFAHKGGLHVAAILKDPNTYQHIDPSLVGNQRRVLVSELSGRRNILAKAEELGLLPTQREKDEQVESEWNLRSKLVLDQVKDLENRGYSFEGAEASLELMLRRAVKGYTPPFELLDFSVSTDNKRVLYEGDYDVFPTDRSTTLATVKLALLGPAGMEDTCPTKICLEAAEGIGPVDAINGALEKALFSVYTELRTVSLVDYKVRILDNENSTRAITRVMVEFADSATQRQWTTVSANPNIIVASVNALTDGFEVAMWDTVPQCIR